MSDKKAAVKTVSGKTTSDNPMPDKPSYLGLLNAVSLAESRAYGYLTEWAARTPSAEVRQVLLTVAAREGEHGMTFAKRINELGYQLRPKSDDGIDKALEVVRSDCSDREKMEALGLDKLDTGSRPDVFDGFFADHSIDIRTAEMLGRYIAEERDSARLLRRCYEALVEASAGSAAGNGKDRAGSASKAVRATEKRMESLDSKVDALGRAVEDLRQVVTAQTVRSAARA
jgi:hypothetical protein